MGRDHRTLENVIDSYDDFVIGLRSDLRYHPENIETILKFISDDPTRTTSDIIEYEWFLEGIDINNRTKKGQRCLDFTI